MRVQIPFWLAAMLVLGLAGCGSSDSPQTTRPPNFIVILTDDQGFGDAGFHGNAAIRTPTLDQFADEGTERTHFSQVHRDLTPQAFSDTAEIAD